MIFPVDGVKNCHLEVAPRSPRRRLTLRLRCPHRIRAWAPRQRKSSTEFFLALNLVKVPYSSLNAKQREAHNFQKVSAALADYGFATLRLQDDWLGADFIAQHCSGDVFLKIQLKSRAVLATKYQGKDLLIAFPHDNAWYLYEHDALLAHVSAMGMVVDTASWQKDGSYSWPAFPAHMVNSGLIHSL